MRKSIPSPDGWNTIHKRFGAAPAKSSRTRWRKGKSARRTWQRSGLRTSAKPQLYGTRKPESRSPMRSYGQDIRVADDVARFSRAGGADRFRAKTGLPISTYFSALKIRWILTNIPGARKQAESGDLLFGTMDTFLAWHLTGGPQGGVHITDVTNASRTQLMNLSTLAWDRDILKEYEIPEALLPRICASSGMLGEIRHPALAGLPLCGILGDQQAALVGQVCFQPGEAKNTYGTGCFLL